MVMKKRNVNIVKLVNEFEESYRKLKYLDPNDKKLQEFRVRLGFNRIIDSVRTYGARQNIVMNPNVEWDECKETLDLSQLTSINYKYVKAIVSRLIQSKSREEIAIEIGINIKNVDRVLRDFNLKRPVLKYIGFNGKVIEGKNIKRVWQSLYDAGITTRQYTTFRRKISTDHGYVVENKQRIGKIESWLFVRKISEKLV